MNKQTAPARSLLIDPTNRSITEVWLPVASDSKVVRDVLTKHVGANTTATPWTHAGARGGTLVVQDHSQRDTKPLHRATVMLDNQGAFVEIFGPALLHRLLPDGNGFASVDAAIETYEKFVYWTNER